MHEGWREVTVEDVAQVIGGGTPKSNVEDYWGGEIPWLTPKDLSERPSRYTAHGTRNITQSGLDRSSAKLLPEGTVLLTSRAPVGYVSVAANSIATNQGFKSLVLDDTQLPEFWYYLLGHSTDYLRANSGGSTFQELSGSVLRKLRFIVPPLEEQRRIVDLIGALDDTIAATEIAEQSSWRLFEQIADSVAAQSLSGAAVPLAEAVSLIDCEHKTAPEAKSAAYGHSIGTGNIRDGVISMEKAKPISRETFEEWTSRATPQEGDVILTREAPPGEVGLVTGEHGPIALGQRTVLLQSKVGTYGPFLWALLASPRYRKWIASRTVGQTVQRINVREILAIPVTLPGLNVQQMAAQQVQETIDLALRHRRLVAHLGQLRSNLLTILLSGEHEIPRSYDVVMGELVGTGL